MLLDVEKKNREPFDEIINVKSQCFVAFSMFYILNYINYVKRIKLCYCYVFLNKSHLLRAICSPRHKQMNSFSVCSL